MTLCPVAIAVGCRKCPIFKVCPLKSVIGDYRAPEERAPAPAAKASAKPAAKAAKRSGKSKR